MVKLMRRFNKPAEEPQQDGTTYRLSGDALVDARLNTQEKFDTEFDNLMQANQLEDWSNKLIEDRNASITAAEEEAKEAGQTEEEQLEVKNYSNLRYRTMIALGAQATVTGKLVAKGFSKTLGRLKMFGTEGRFEKVGENMQAKSMENIFATLNEEWHETNNIKRAATYKERKLGSVATLTTAAGFTAGIMTGGTSELAKYGSRALIGGAAGAARTYIDYKNSLEQGDTFDWKTTVKAMGKNALKYGAIATVSSAAAMEAMGHGTLNNSGDNILKASWNALPDTVGEADAATMPFNLAANVKHIDVPGTGSAPDHNIINGDRATLGYAGEAGPFVGQMRYNESVGQGVNNLLRLMENSPNVQSANGYSQGADVLREAVSKLSPAEQRQLVLNLSGDPSGRTGILTLAHDSPQGQIMNMLGFDTSPLKSTGGATVHETVVSNDIMADARYTLLDASKFNKTIERGDFVGAMRMLANTGEGAGGYATTHSGIIGVGAGDRATYNPNNPGNASVTTERTANGTLTTITPNVTAAEGILAQHTGIRLTPEARAFYESAIDPSKSNSDVIAAAGNAAKEGINNTPWLPPEAQTGLNNAVDAVFATPKTVTPQEVAAFNAAPAPQSTYTEPVYTAPVVPDVSDYVPPAVQAPVQEVTEQINNAASNFNTAVGNAQRDVNNVLSGLGVPRR